MNHSYTKQSSQKKILKFLDPKITNQPSKFANIPSTSDNSNLDKF